ncbi:Pyridoxal-5'-phosphate-dependent enzyme, beta subunit:ornithine cyclodeaminase/mu-crystallin [Pseudomonas syringae pv. philadelphi]|uniref:cysteine synthase n=1 Tax=Pseudomonas syringae pv. philadelphi TaxID=251706 RepID=A0A3M3ZLG4_9PSED|nr:2,3-diaminopropionate biosynthesis protein SbnA [Pseudomonas syringae group genomosp. 3]RMO94935.1 Pyridoxal-5'-phosphate-dependent enzyme, beta subunit:ornithine cyclodeaminase/mu-crystallin [Pseudomonas syringae pv. philadelphi]
MHNASEYQSLCEIVHDQAFLKVTGLGHDFFLKMESLNPAGSIKLKTAVGLINDVQARGLLGPETILIESSSGNLGVALAMICAERGIAFTCVVDPNSSSHNIRMMRSYGAEVIQVENPDANGGFLGTRIALIRHKVASDRRYVWLNQYENPANPRAHSRTTASSISRHFGHVDYLFVGAGTTGTLMGCIQHFQRHHPATKIIAVDSVGSVTFDTPAGRRFIPGLGTSQRPPIFDSGGIHALEMVPEARTVAMCRILARSKGLLVGGSTATVIAAVHAWRERIEPGSMVVALSPDWGERYLDTLYDDHWVEQRFGRDVLNMTLADLSGSTAIPCGSGPGDVTGEPAQDFSSWTVWLAAERLKNAPFHVVDGEVVARLLAADPLACIDDVQTAYLEHDAGRTINPDSYFLRFPEAPANRIIALPASLTGEQPVSGIKWISSFPGNVDTRLQRASAVLILNDPATGYAFACLEASRISAMRTAASAVLGARWMNRHQRHVGRMAFVGAGFIARTILDMFVSDGWTMGTVNVFDQHEDSMRALVEHASGRHQLNGEAADLPGCLQADVVVFATTAPSPYVLEPLFRPGQVLLNISLRDLGPEVIAQANNILDDVEHCLKAQTSPDLAVRHYQDRSFITGTLAQLMNGQIELAPDRPAIFSPFGLGVLDLALGQRLYRQALAEGSALPVPRFFFESSRW